MSQPFDLPTFMDLMTAHMAASASPALEYANTPRALWRYRFVEGSDATDPVSQLAPLPLGVLKGPDATVPLQCLTSGKNAVVAFNRAWALFKTILDAQGLPKKMVDLGGGYRLIGVLSPRLPGVVAAQETKTMVAFNFDAMAANLNA